MKTKKLSDLAGTIRSKNAGVNQVSFDIIFYNAENYKKVKKSGILTKKSMAKLFGIKPERIPHFVEVEAANAIKFTIYRLSPNGSPGESDVYGSQHYSPLLDIEVPWD